MTSDFDRLGSIVASVRDYKKFLSEGTTNAIDILFKHCVEDISRYAEILKNPIWDWKNWEAKYGKHRDIASYFSDAHGGIDHTDKYHFKVFTQDTLLILEYVMLLVQLDFVKNPDTPKYFYIWDLKRSPLWYYESEVKDFPKRHRRIKNLLPEGKQNVQK